MIDLGKESKEIGEQELNISINTVGTTESIKEKVNARNLGEMKKYLSSLMTFDSALKISLKGKFKVSLKKKIKATKLL